MSIEYRKANKSDSQNIHELVLEQLELHILPNLTEKGSTTLTNFMSKENLEKLMDNDHQFFVAIAQGQIIGVAGIKNLNHLMALYVSDDNKHQGIGKSLWKIVKSYSEEKGFKGIFTLNSSGNALEFYKKVGFEIVGETSLCDGIISTPMEYRGSNLEINGNASLSLLS